MFHWWGMVIIRNWRKDERNKAFIQRLKRMWPKPTPSSGDARRRRQVTGPAPAGAPRREAPAAVVMTDPGC